jgi:hypothetical protein
MVYLLAKNKLRIELLGEIVYSEREVRFQVPGLRREDKIKGMA